RIETEGFNELGLKWQPFTPMIRESIKLVGAQLDFFPSPMSKLWSPVPLHQLKSHSEETARRNFRNIESVLTRKYESLYPSIFECFLRLNTPDDKVNDVELQEFAI